MKLAEALILRADTKKRFEQLRQRLMNNAKVQEGDQPAEKPEDLLKEIEAAAKEYETLIKQINKTNSETVFAKGKTLTDAAGGTRCFDFAARNLFGFDSGGDCFAADVFAFGN